MRQPVVSLSLCLFGPCPFPGSQDRCLIVSLSLSSFCLKRRQRKARFSQCLPVLLRRPSIGLWNISSESPHAALVWFHHVIAAGIEGYGLVVHIYPPAAQLSFALLAVQSDEDVSFVVFDPHAATAELTESYRVVRLPDHVLNVAVQAHMRVEEHGDGRPSAVGEAALEKIVHGSTGRLPGCCIRDAAHAPVSE